MSAIMARPGPSRFAFLISCVLVFGCAAPESHVSGEVQRVVDGDSLYLVGHEPQIRLWGVDAPERAEKGFAEATALLRKLASEGALRCDPVDIDRYGRTVARCYRSDGLEINERMISSGLTEEYCKYTDGYYGRC